MKQCSNCHYYSAKGQKHYPFCSYDTESFGNMTATGTQITDYFKGTGFKVPYVSKGETTAMQSNQVIEAVVLKRATKDEPATILFGPKAYVAADVTSAIVQATADAIAGGVTIDATTEVRTRFFG